MLCTMPTPSLAKTLLFSFLLLLWTLFIPLAVVIYTPWSYQLNCHWNERCAQFGEAESEQAGQELAAFFRHQRPLPERWTPKEQAHLLEVRGMYDKALLVFVVLTGLLLVNYSRERSAYRRYWRFSIGWLLVLLLLMLALTPVFNYFWMEIFHPLLFDNELWRTNPEDVSWYLMPKTYFIRVILFLLVATLILQMILLYCAPRTTNQPPKSQQR